MCCIIHRPVDAKAIPEDNLKSIIKINPHGWGLSYCKDKKIHIVKSMEMDDAIAAIRELEKDNIEFLFHARWATHGEKNISNCHPYDIQDGVLFHNGKINVYCRSDKMSDTYYFSLKVNKFLRKKKTIEWILNKFKSAIGPSRLAIMTTAGEVIKTGYWSTEDGCDYSKLNWKYQNNYNYGYGGWSEYSAAPTVAYNSQTNKDAYELCLERCANDQMLFKFDLKKLNEKQLVTIAINYPQLAGEVLHRNFSL